MKDNTLGGVQNRVSWGNWGILADTWRDTGILADNAK